MFGANSDRCFNEMREFASFESSCRRFITCSLDIASQNYSSAEISKRWARDIDELSELKVRIKLYGNISTLKKTIPKPTNVVAVSTYHQLLIPMTEHDLQVEKINCFSAYRFLYERLLGAKVRPILPSAYLAAAMLPTIRPEQRKILAQSMSEAAATAPGWSPHEPVFFPEWVEKVAI